MILEAIRKVYASRELLYMIASRDLQLRYKQTIMGFLWALLTPAMVVGAGVLMRLIISGGGKLDGVVIGAVLVKSLAWAFFTSAVKSSTGSLIGNKNLVAKMAFPKEVFPLASVAGALVDFGVSCLVGVAVLLLLVPQWTAWALLALPIVVLLIILATGIGLMLSALNLFFRDIKYIVDAILSFAIFFTPVVYDAEMLGRFAPLVMLNPVAPLLEALRSVVVLGLPPSWPWLGYSLVWAGGCFVVGYRVFKNLEYKFAESI